MQYIMGLCLWVESRESDPLTKVLSCRLRQSKGKGEDEKKKGENTWKME